MSVLLMMRESAQSVPSETDNLIIFGAASAEPVCETHVPPYNLSVSMANTRSKAGCIYREFSQQTIL
jgi:hypothetical protein